jgi:predicted nuclease of restriction endonuclease-like RecB superfamily
LLPADRLAFRVVGEEVVPRYLDEADHPWLRDLLDVLLASEGQPARVLSARLREALPHAAPSDKLRMAAHIAQGLLETSDPPARVRPRRMRATLFALAAQARRAGGQSRSEIVASAAEALSVDTESLLSQLFADLPSERRVCIPLSLPSPRELALRTNLALVQGLLRRAVAVRLTLLGNARDIVRHVRLQGLLCVARRVEGGVRLELSGPFALFRRTTLYGRAQASIVPRLPWCERFALEAEVVLDGKERRLRLGPADPVFPAQPPRRFDSQLEEAFARDLARRFPQWGLIREPVALDAGENLIFPDFALFRREQPEIRWLVELAGFWTADYLTTKLEGLRRAGVAGLVLCVDAARNCAESDLPPQVPVVRYRRRVDPADVLAAIEALPEGTVTRQPATETLSLRSYFLDWAGRHPADHPVHAKLRALQPGQRVRLSPEGSACWVVDEAGSRLAALSSAARQAWEPKLADILEVTVREKVERRRADSGAAYRHLLRVERWWVPLVDILLCRGC